MPEIYEVVKQYVVDVEGLDIKVKARIGFNSTSGIYYWDISHYYKPSTRDATPYQPSRRADSTFEVVDRLLLDYLSSFTNIGVVANPRY